MERTIEELYQQLDEIYWNGEAKDVAVYLNQKIREVEESGETESLYFACCNSEAGAFYRGIADYQNAEHHFKNAGEILRSILGEMSADYATNCNNLAGVYRMCGKPEKALELFLEAERIYAKTIGTEHYLFASLQNNISLAYKESQQYDEAIARQIRAIEIISLYPERREELATSYSNLAVLHSVTGMLEDALEAQKKATELIRESDFHYSPVWNSMGTIEMQMGDFAKAEDSFLKAYTAVQRFFGKGEDYRKVCRNLLQLYEKTGQTEKQRQIQEILEQTKENQ